ncbi:hypothetical protein FN846DRAFT_577081 [Sphaerosporella brunnea]|uniref:Uncharacterized protein n=1 Tax=Sphaerosporella brunnea TaxID=1250544 RepID=A0A5J5F2Q6_9PEZI|nr:hypothetical protein FN846DRAFT_577081 [Sphaerosporella brunnea]
MTRNCVVCACWQSMAQVILQLVHVGVVVLAVLVHNMAHAAFVCVQRFVTMYKMLVCIQKSFHQNDWSRTPASLDHGTRKQPHPSSHASMKLSSRRRILNHNTNSLSKTSLSTHNASQQQSKTQLFFFFFFCPLPSGSLPSNCAVPEMSEDKKSSKYQPTTPMQRKLQTTSKY